LVKDDSGPVDVEGLGHMCVLQKGFWKGRKCVLKIMMGSSPMGIDVAGCKVLDTPLAGPASRVSGGMMMDWLWLCARLVWAGLDACRG